MKLCAFILSLAVMWLPGLSALDHYFSVVTREDHGAGSWVHAIWIGDHDRFMAKDSVPEETLLAIDWNYDDIAPLIDWMKDKLTPDDQAIILYDLHLIDPKFLVKLTTNSESFYTLENLRPSIRNHLTNHSQLCERELDSHLRYLMHSHPEHWPRLYSQQSAPSLGRLLNYEQVRSFLWAKNWFTVPPSESLLDYRTSGFTGWDIRIRPGCECMDDAMVGWQWSTHNGRREKMGWMADWSDGVPVDVYANYDTSSTLLLVFIPALHTKRGSPYQGAAPDFVFEADTAFAEDLRSCLTPL